MKKREFTAEYKAKILLEILREEKKVSEIASREEINLLTGQGKHYQFSITHKKGSYKNYPSWKTYLFVFIFSDS